jgi:UDP-N-acetylbacillosamine N-acetyltransferase
MILSGKNKRVNVLGAGGHARSVIALLERCEYGVEGVYDDGFQQGTTELIAGIPLRGAIPPAGTHLVLALGNGAQRTQALLQYQDLILENSVIDPSVIVTKDVSIGKYNLIMSRTVINTDAKIGDNNIINTGAIIEHESVIGNNNHISVGAILCGRVIVGNNCFLGAGTIVADKISICNDVITGAGAVVVKNITEPGTYVGCPAKKIK